MTVLCATFKISIWYTNAYAYCLYIIISCCCFFYFPSMRADKESGNFSFSHIFSAHSIFPIFLIFNIFTQTCNAHTQVSMYVNELCAVRTSIYSVSYSIYSSYLNCRKTWKSHPWILGIYIVMVYSIRVKTLYTSEGKKKISIEFLHTQTSERQTKNRREKLWNTITSSESEPII